MSRPRAVGEYEYRLLPIRDQSREGVLLSVVQTYVPKLRCLSGKCQVETLFSNDVMVGKITPAA